MDGKICVDASFALKLVLSETDSGLAHAEWQNWLQAGLEITAPDLFTYQTTSVLRNRVFRREITQSEADEALEILAGLEITYQHPSALQESAWVLARDINRPTAYAAFYLALAQHEGCPFWTGDKRLYNSVKHRLKWVHVLGQ